MTRKGAAQPRTGVMLLEVLLILAMISLAATLTTWGLTVQMHTQKRLALQAHRQCSMRAVLTRLREDLSDASRIECRRDVDSPRSSEGVVQTAPVRVFTSEGVVSYQVRDDASNALGMCDASGRSGPPRLTLVRTGMDGRVDGWDMHGLSVTLRPDPRAPAQLLRVRFESVMKYKTGHHKIRRFQITLAAGLAP